MYASTLKKILYMLLIAPTWLSAAYKVTHNVRFLIQNKSYDATTRKRKYILRLSLLDDKAQLNVQDKNNKAGMFLDDDTPKTFVFDTDTQSEQNIQAIENFKVYIQDTFIDQIKNYNKDEAQIDIILDMFAPVNDFTKPYHELYQKIKEFCAHVGIIVTEPQRLSWWQQLWGRS